MTDKKKFLDISGMDLKQLQEQIVAEIRVCPCVNGLKLFPSLTFISRVD